jgi:hypothetical protein
MVCDYIVSTYFYGVCGGGSAVIFTGAVVGAGTFLDSVLPNGFSLDASFADCLYKNPAI